MTHTKPFYVSEGEVGGGEEYHPAKHNNFRGGIQSPALIINVEHIIKSFSIRVTCFYGCWKMKVILSKQFSITCRIIF